jgi:hypothetical protein
LQRSHTGAIQKETASGTALAVSGELPFEAQTALLK